MILPSDHILFQGPGPYKGWLGYEYPCIISIIEMMLVCKDEKAMEKIDRINSLIKSNKVQTMGTYKKIEEVRHFFSDMMNMCKLIHSLSVCSFWKNTQFIPASLDDAKLYTGTQKEYAGLLGDWIGRVHAKLFPNLDM